MDISYHYPPELFQLLVDTIPRLCRSKKDLLIFFRGAGIGDGLLADHRIAVNADPDSVNKFEITRSVLTRLNEHGERTLRERRELLKRVVEFEDFSTCWPNDQAAAKGHVADIRRIVDVKDSFTRMRQEKDRERQARIQEREKRAARLRQEREARVKVRQALYGLFKEDFDPHERGSELEVVLTQLFQLDGILVREPFRRGGADGRTIEQIDGAVEVAGHLYLVEMKWHKDPIGVQDVHVLLSRLFLRPGEARGIFISASGYTVPALEIQRDAASKRVLLLCQLEQLVQVLECDEKVGEFFKSRANRVITELRSS